MTILKDNVAASLDTPKLTKREKMLFDMHARQTASYYCTGCAEYCESAMNHDVPISDMIRCLMYAYEYEKTDSARHILRQLSSDNIKHLKIADFTSAENACPKKMPISIMMKEALKLLT